MLTSLLAAVPQPPTHDVMPKTAERIFNVFIFVPLGLALAVAVRHIVRGRGPLLLFCIAGGAAAACWEPVVDVLGLCYMKERGAQHIFSAMGRSMPLFICFVYPWYVGGLGYLTSKLFARGVTVRQMFGLWALVGVIDIWMETPGIVLGAYVYYGPQPFNLWGFPLWWAFVNPVMPMTAGALIHKLRPHLSNSWKLLTVVALIPMADGIANAATAFPMWIALNQNAASFAWSYLASGMTLGLSLLCVWIIGLLVARSDHELAGVTLTRQLRGLVTDSAPSGVAVSPTPAAAGR